MKKLLILSVIILVSIKCKTIKGQEKKVNTKQEIERKVDSLLQLMTIEEKVGQMNQYNGFWDVTGPIPDGGSAEKKYEHLRKGWVGSMLSVRGVKEVRAVQKIVVEESRL